MLKVCPYKCKESSDLNFRGKLKAIHIAYLKNRYRYSNDILKMARQLHNGISSNDILRAAHKAPQVFSSVVGQSLHVCKDGFLVLS